MLDIEGQAVIDTVREYVRREVRPVDREQVKALGVFGPAVPEPCGEAPVSMPCYSLVTSSPPDW